MYAIISKSIFLLLFFFSTIAVAQQVDSLSQEFPFPDSLEMGLDSISDVDVSLLEVQEMDTVLISDDSLGAEWIPDAPFDLVADRLSCLSEEMQIAMNFNPKVHSFIEYFSIRNRDYTRMVMSRMHIYFPIFEEYLAKYGLPDELKYLAIVESGLNPTAISRAGAGGLWQFMPGTGRYYKLHQDWYIDERLDPYKATEAACKYLAELYRMFGDWELALASYNAGPGNVRKAIRKSGFKNSFWEIYNHLPKETRSYVPQFVAVTYVLNHLKEHNLEVEDQYFARHYEEVELQGYAHLSTIAEMIDVCPDDLKRLNPAVKRGALPDNNKSYAIRIPSDRWEVFDLEKELILDSAAKVGKAELEYLAKTAPGGTYGREKIVYKVRSGDVLGKIAVKYNVSVADLRKWNNLNGNMIRIGQSLNIWLDATTYNRVMGSPAPVASAKTPVQPIIEGDKKFHLVQPGDTLWKISKQYEGLTIDKIKQMNSMSNDQIKPGQKLIIG